MKKNGAVDIICKIISVLLSIVLVISLIATTLLFSISQMLKPEALIDIITKIDYGQIFSENASAYILPQKAQTQVLSANITYREEVYDGDSQASNAITVNGTQNEDGSVTVTMPNGQVVTMHPGNSTTVIDGVSGNRVYEADGDRVTSQIGGGSFGFSGSDTTGTIGSMVEPGFEGEGEETIDGSMGSAGDFGGLGEILEGITGGMDKNQQEFVGEMVTDFMETDVAKEIFDEYASAVTEAIQGNEEASLDEEKVKEIIIENKDEIFDFVEKYTGEKFDREALGAYLDQFIEENIGNVVSSLPKPNEVVKEIPPEVLQIVNILTNGKLLKALITIDCVLILLIFVLRLWELSGFLWLSIDGIVLGVFLTVIYGVISFGKNVLISLVSQVRSIIDAVLTTASTKILICLLITFALSAIFMTLFFVLKNIRKKSKKAV